MNLPGPHDWRWVRDFLDDPATDQLLDDGQVGPWNVEAEVRALCIERLRAFRRAYLAGDNELAWKCLDHAHAVYLKLPELRTVHEDFALIGIREWTRLGDRGAKSAARRKRELLRNEAFRQFLRLGGIDPDEFLASIKSAENSSRASRPRPNRQRNKRLTLKQRGFDCVVEEDLWIRASELIDLVEAGAGSTRRCYDCDDHNIRLRLDDQSNLVIEDLSTGVAWAPIPTVPTDQIRNALKEARRRIELAG